MAVRPTILAVLVGMAVAGDTARAQVIAPAFANNYSFVDLGPAAGVPAPFGGLTLKAGDPNTLLLGGSSEAASGGIYQIAVTRAAGNHITGFAGAATLFATAPNIDGGLAYGPNNVLFYTAYPINRLGQIKPGSSAPDKLIDLTPLGVSGTVGTANFVPTGFPGAGGIRILSYSPGELFGASLTPDGSGTYDLSALTLLTNPSALGPLGLIHVPPASPVFTGPSALISEYLGSRVSAYGLDAGGTPIPGSRQDFLTGLSGADGAFVDPVTGDFLFSTFGAGHVFVVRAVAVPEPSALALAGIAAAGALALRRGRRWPGGLDPLTTAPDPRDP